LTRDSRGRAEFKGSRKAGEALRASSSKKLLAPGIKGRC
jgi:hypothetical protein